MKTRIKIHWKVICLLVLVTAVVGCHFVSSYTAYFNNTNGHTADSIEVWGPTINHIGKGLPSVVAGNARPTFTVFILPWHTLCGTVPPNATNYEISISTHGRTSIEIHLYIEGRRDEAFWDFTIDQDGTTIDIP